MTEGAEEDKKAATKADKEGQYYRIRRRPFGREHLAHSIAADFVSGETVMIREEDRLEPATVVCRTVAPAGTEDCACEISRRAGSDEQERYAQLPAREQAAAAFCKERVNALTLPMHLVGAECYFNGSKVIFYFTAENRVDFRELVKDLVQEFRTRVEMRQIGVRHETQMTGGLGTCGRELCCSSFLRTFESVSIKMAKAQDLPLNPAKISGVCNRLLCCLTYEFDSYREMKWEMPKPGQQLSHEGIIYRVTRVLPIPGKVLAVSSEGNEVTLTEEQWRAAENADRQGQQVRKKSGGKKEFPQKRKKS
jgi:cell fate regulator YaaT (PSP1 superfamily)